MTVLFLVLGFIAGFVAYVAIACYSSPAKKELWLWGWNHYREKLAEFFAATRRYPGAGIYFGAGKYVGFKASADRFGIVFYLGIFYALISYYDFHASSRQVMAEVQSLRQKNAALYKMFGNRTTGRKRQ